MSLFIQLARHKKPIARILLSGLWIAFSEFARNELLFKYVWVRHYDSLHLTFETTPLNGILWLLWSIIFSYGIYELLSVFSVKKTIALAWIFGFVLMWITIFNLQVLPLRLLLWAIPLSGIEVYVSVLLLKKLTA